MTLADEYVVTGRGADEARRRVEAWVKLGERVPLVEVQRAWLWGVEPLVAGNAGNCWRENKRIIRSSVEHKKILTLLCEESLTGAIYHYNVVKSSGSR